ncbi:MAG: hypothetical protein JSW71_06480 [Gemmatimonadota bacterium]|nr:MAG: hypothetical protein JSW71_06480 [Gemmatimonadota bacterium]
MTPFRLWLSVVAISATLLSTPVCLTAQVTRSDSAAVLLDAARRLEARGDSETTRRLLVFIIQAYDGTQAASEAAVWLGTVRRVTDAGSGRAGLMVWNTLFGAWLGVAIPAAFGSESEEAFGAGLLIGAPLGFFGTKAFTANYPVSSGQAITAAFGSMWGTWQAVGWRSVLDIGSETRCDAFSDYCGEYTPDEAPFTAAVLGGLAGIAAGGAVAAARNPTAGDATLVTWSSFWGTWYGLAGGVLADAEGDALLTWGLIGGNVGLIASAVATKSWTGSAGRVWMITAAGLAGGLAGVGIDLLGSVEDEKAAVLIPALTSAAGLAIGTAITRSQPNGFDEPDLESTQALVNLNGGDWSLGMPLPLPTLLSRHTRDGRMRTALGVQIPLLTGRF